MSELSAASNNQLKPLIGLVPHIEPRFNGHGRATSSQQDIVDAIHEAGADAIIFTRTSEPSSIQRIVDMCDGFLFPGGYDVDPARYGEEPVNDTVMMEPDSDAFEFALMDRVLASGKPVLCICRGSQVLNVALGGTLWQDIPSQLQANQPEDQHTPHMVREPDNAIAHTVDIVADSLLDRTLVPFNRREWVSSTHHQAIRKVADGMTVSATAPDGIIEAIEPAADGPFAGRFMLAVQWHPEVLWRTYKRELYLFAGLVNAAKDTQTNHSRQSKLPLAE